MNEKELKCDKLLELLSQFEKDFAEFESRLERRNKLPSKTRPRMSDDTDSTEIYYD